MKQRYLEIDGIRGILCVLILLHHLDSITNAFIKNQACLAVEIFVCLAGFMMAYNCKVIEDRQYYDYNGIYIYNFIIFIFSFSFLFKSMYLNRFVDKIIY